MNAEIKRLEELRQEASALIEEGTPESLKRAKTLLTHQQFLLREIINASRDALSVSEVLEVEAGFLKTNEKLQKQ